MEAEDNLSDASLIEDDEEEEEELGAPFDQQPEPEQKLEQIVFESDNSVEDLEVFHGFTEEDVPERRTLKVEGYEEYDFDLTSKLNLVQFQNLTDRAETF